MAWVIQDVIETKRINFPETWKLSREETKLQTYYECQISLTQIEIQVDK